MEDNIKSLIKKIKAAAKRDALKRNDARYLKTMGLLVAKGFLKTNDKIVLQPSAKILFKDAVWAGKNVEPRILEVLPAAIARLPHCFILTEREQGQIKTLTMGLIKNNKAEETELWGIPFFKFKPWFSLPLLDKRTKTPSEKKIVRTYRLHPLVIQKLKHLANQEHKTETEVLENLIQKSKQKF